ncbi:MAG: gliding motility-associated C-terminal domain-containing protein [Bacteroidia bacterium]|nr:gliding motility-associated C-terminal domain-containing protein [Bacteroidia bacterium]
MSHKTTLYLFFNLLLFALTFTNAQTIVCETSSCTANDYTLDNFYLGDEFGVPFGPGYCDPGDVVNAHLWTTFSANSAAPRYTLYLHFNLYVDGVFEATIDECYYEGLPIPTNVTLDAYQFSWSCGSEITLQNFYMSWRPNANAPCGCSNSKCYKEETIIVQAPLIANFEFTPSCESAFTLDFISTSSGGNPPYTYLWDFGDGSTSTLQNPSHTYTSTGPYTVTLTVSDQDNTDSYLFEIVSFDPNLPPEIYPPPNLNIEGCDLIDIPDLPFSTTSVNLTEAEFNAAGGTLALSSQIVSFTYIDTLSGTCPITVTRTFSIVDSCDNSATEVQIISINDTTLPTASNPVSISVDCIGNVPSPDINVVTDATDNCSVPTVLFVSEVSDNNSCPEAITRTYSITDDCGNTITVTQIIVINDTILPTASNPSDIIVECMSDVPVPNVNVITDEADNCSVPVVAFVSEQADGNTCPINITRIYSVTDDCGNSIELTQNIIVNDTTPPIATGPADINAQCISDVPAVDLNDITNVSDNCSTPTVSFVSEESDNGTCPQIITRTFSILDECGNETILTQTITVLDDVVPTGTSPAPINVQCISDVPSPDINVITGVSDNCSIPTVTFISDVTTGQCPQIITRTYRIIDDCGNFMDIIQDINVNDDIAPTASDPAPIYVDCSDTIPSPDVSVVTDETDNCSLPIVAFVSDTSDGNCPETIFRIYSVTDECGNTINVTQEIIFDDTEAPTLLTPLADDTVSCTAIPDAPDLEFDDNCTTNLMVDFTQTDTNNNNTVDYSITRIWVVTDNCGNSSTFTQIINVLIADCITSVCNSCGPMDDTIPPTASNPADLTVLCTEDIPPPDVNVVIDEADNCMPPIVAFVSETISVDCFEKVTRVYSVTDECGNQILVSHIIDVIDTELPTASNPADINVGCNDDIPVPDINVVTDAADNCSDPVVAFVSDVSDNACNERITRTYSVTDTCGNMITVTQLINVTDGIAPSASNPADVDVSCIDQVPLPDTSVILDESDNCSVPVVSFVSDVSNGNTCPEIITRTYRITDECGNYSDVVQLIKISDDIAPTASNLAQIQISCNSDIPVPNINLVADEADNCSIPTVSFVSDVSDNSSCPETILRTYRVTDNCGNFIDITQEIIIDDTIFPTASNPADLQIVTINDLPAPDPSIVIDEADNCSIPMVAFVSESSDGLSCPETITRIYSVTDACNNSIEVSHKILIADDESPTASNPETLNFSCETEVPSPDTNVVTDASDNQSVPVINFISESSNNQTCPEVITRIYEVSDDCGNTIQVTQNILIDDDIPPTASNPADTIIYNDDPIPQPDPLVVIDEMDNCSIPLVAFVSEINNNDECPEIITRTYSVTDDCGNSINVLHNIFIEDTEPPTASDPENMDFYCVDSSNIPAPDINIIDDASDNISTPTIIFVSDTSDDGSCPEIITRIYRITDSCGNSIDVSQEFHLYNDQEPPTASEPELLTLECIDDLPDPDVEIIDDEVDNCSSPTVTFTSETIDSIDCQLIVTRTYTVTDACGNAIEVDHLISIEDQSAPELITEYDEELTIYCGIVPEVPLLDFVDACDNDLNINFEEITSDTGDENYDIIRTWDVTDDCDNSISVSQIIHMEIDNSPAQTVLNLCINEDPINLNSIVNVQDGGVWEGSDLDILDDYILDPAEVNEGSYSLSYIVTQNECVRVHDILIDVNDLCIDYPCIESVSDVSISKMVTPNNDGRHDFLEVGYVINDASHDPCEIVIELVVYNRWGNKVYSSTNYNNDWGGRSPSNAFGNDEFLPSGSYYYVVTLRNSDLKPIQGYIYLGVEK